MTGKKKQFRRLWQNINSRRRQQLVVLLLLMFLTSIAEVIGIGSVMPFLAVLTAPETLYSHPAAQSTIQLLQIKSSHDLLLPITVIFIIAVMVSGSMRLLLIWFQTRLGHAIGADLSFEIYKRTLYQPYSVHVERNTSDVIAAISQKSNLVVPQTIVPILTIISSTIMLSGILLILIIIEPFVAFLVFFGFGGIYSIIMLFSKKQLSFSSKQISKNQGLILKSLQEGLGGIRDVLIDGVQSYYCKAYRSADLPLRRARANVQIIGTTPRFVIEALGMSLIAIIAFLLSNKSTDIASAIPILGTLVFGTQRLLPLLQQSYASWSLIRSDVSSLSDTLELLEQPLPHHMILPSKPVIFNSILVLKKVAFKFRLQNNYVLHDLDLSITKGSKVGIIGTTGSGKSTLLDIIMGLIIPSNGQLMVDGEVVTKSNCRSWQKHIAHVPQVIFLADATISENIAFGVPLDQIDMKRVREAAEQAQILEAIESWSETFNTVVGERGVRLSGGQRQRIGLARALYKNTDLIILDEATSALDNETEQIVMKEIDNIDKTIIIVAHRLTTLKGCDKIVKLIDGRIK